MDKPAALRHNAHVAFTFAHLTDPHLPLRPGDCSPLALAGKRITGAFSWGLNRRHIHKPEVLAALIADIRAQAPDHIVVTGDLANIAARGEIARAGDWLESLGPARDVTVIPGNHDAYVRGAALDRWRDRMRGAPPSPEDSSGFGAASTDKGFPFLRRRGPVAFVGLSTARPTAPFMAWGALGSAQLEALDGLLARLEGEGACRVVLLHHPPAGKEAHGYRKGMHDHDAFARVIAARGAELILHGHTHHWTLNALPGPAGSVPVLSAASASAAPVRGQQAANWNLIRVAGEAGAWRLSAEARGLTGAGDFGPLRAETLSSNKIRLD